MIACWSCGKGIAEDFRLCPYCGTPVGVAPLREQRKRVTILFCDVTGSTALGESTDPEALRSLLARYFARMKGIIESHGGTVEKFIGDAVMAVFGVPRLHEDDALRACRAALEMRAALPELGIQCRIGVNSGEVVAGTRERLATGDAVNVAARLEQAAPPGDILIGEETLRLVRATVEVAATEPLSLKGKSEPVPAFRLLVVNELAARPASAAPMVGRGRELDRLQDAFAQAVEDRSCQLFTILGSAGVGKSRLAAEFLQGLDGAQVLRARCLSYGEGITYWPVVEVIKQIGLSPADPYADATVRSLLGERAASTTADEIAWAFRLLLEQEAQSQPLVVVFDDIHWGEETFLDLVEHVADLSQDASILLLCMARPELLEKRPAWGGGKWNATTVLLEPLDAAETDELLDALGGVSDEMRERIRQAAEGNPLYVEEMLALIRESGGEAIAVPPTIQALLAARLDQLAPEERAVLEYGAVEGRVFHRSAVQTLANESNSLQQRLLTLVRKQLVRPDRAQLRNDEAYRFRHLLIRDAAYEALPKSVRADLHERFARWLEERGADLVELDEIVGYHLEQAARYNHELGQPDAALAEQAGERLARAGRQALWRGDMGAAQGLLERALVLFRPLRLDVDLELNLISTQPRGADWVTMTEALADRARAAGDRPGEAVARVEAAHHRTTIGTGSVEELETLAQEAIPLLEAAKDNAGLARVWYALGQGVASPNGQYERWAQAAEQAVLHRRQVGQPGLLGLPYPLILGPRPADEALQTLDSLIADETDRVSWAFRAVLLAMLGRFEEAWDIALESDRRERELTGAEHSQRGVMQIGISLEEIAALEGDHEAAARHMQEVCALLENEGWTSYLSTYAPKLGRSLCYLGRYDEAEPLAQRGRELGDEHDVVTQMFWRQVQGLVLASRGEYAEAEQLVRDAIAIVDRTDALNHQGDARCDLAEVLERAGRAEDAKATLEQALERYQAKRNLAMVAQLRQRMTAMRAVR